MTKDVNIKNVVSYKGAGGKLRFLVTADIGKFSCEDAEIAKKLSATKGAPICIEVDDKGLIIGIIEDATPTPEEAVDEAMPFPEETVEQSIPSDTKPTAQKQPKAEPTAPKAAKPAPTPQATQKDVPKAAAKQEELAKKVTLKTAAEFATSYSHIPTFTPTGAFAFPLLDGWEMEAREQQITEKGVRALLYRDARCDQKRLDMMFGPANWQSVYLPSQFPNSVTCRVSIRINGEWISKEDVGVASQTEPEKGAYSDAFKRAMVQWGSCRELYTAPDIWIPADKTDIRMNAKGKPTLYDTFKVTEVGYNDEREINRLVISGKKGVVFNWTKPKA